MDEKWMKNGFSNGPCIANLPIEIVIVRCVKLPCLLCFSRWDHDQKTIETKIEKQKAELKKKNAKTINITQSKLITKKNIRLIRNPQNLAEHLSPFVGGKP